MKPYPTLKHKLLVITGTWPPMRCGVGDYTQELCRHLADRGWDVQVLTSRAANCLDHPGVTVHAEIDSWSWPLWGCVSRKIRALQPEVINFQWPTAAYGRSLAVNGLPFFLRRIFPHLGLVTTLHELRYFKPWTRFRAWPALRFSQRIILADPLDLGAIRRLAPAALDRCRPIPIGSSLPALKNNYRREDQRRQLGFQKSDFVVTFFGFANPPKGLDTLLKAVAMLRSDHPQIKLLLMSQLDSVYGQSIRQQLAGLGLENAVVQPEYAAAGTAAEMLACADCAALPFVEGISMKRSSAVACLGLGLPVLSTLPETAPFENRKNMLLVPARDSEALADGLREMFQNPELRLRLAQGARDLSRIFSWDEITLKQQEVFLEAGKEVRHAHES
jgi:glycosyltransferase involved in cell wall biosynthesis